VGDHVLESAWIIDEKGLMNHNMDRPPMLWLICIDKRYIDGGPEMKGIEIGLAFAAHQRRSGNTIEDVLGGLSDTTARLHYPQRHRGLVCLTSVKLPYLAWYGVWSIMTSSGGNCTISRTVNAQSGRVNGIKERYSTPFLSWEALAKVTVWVYIHAR